MGISGGVCGAHAASGQDVHCATCGNRADAAATISCLHVFRILALVLFTCLVRNENGRELARVRQIPAQVRRGDCRRPCGGNYMVRTLALEEPADYSLRASSPLCYFFKIGL